MNAVECSKTLRNYNEWRRSDPEDNREAEMPNPSKIGLAIDFAVQIIDAMAGHEHLMVIAATRYCIGRMTYVVGDCANWLIKLWPILPEHTRNIIRRDLEGAFIDDDQARADGDDYKPLGHDCDRAQWETVRALWMKSGVAIASAKADHFRDATKMIDETSAPAIVFYPAGSLGEAVEPEGGTE